MKLNTKKVFYVGLAFFLISMFWQTYDSIITKILIDKFGLNQTWSGVVMALDNILALFLIPLFGGLSDRTNSKRGRRTPYIIVGTVIAAFAFMGLTYSDNVQKSKIEASGSAVITDYYRIYDNDSDLSIIEWQAITDRINDEWSGLKLDGIISEDRYDRVMSNIFTFSDGFTERTIDLDLIYQDGQISEDDAVLLKALFDQHANQRAWVVTTQSPGTFVVFVGTLLVALLAMSIFRSPAVALMPDTTVKPLRSKANAIINLLGTFGGILAILILAIFGLDNLSYVNYLPAFITVGVMMLVFLGLFLWKVKEPKLVAEKLADDVKLNLVEDEEQLDGMYHEEKLPKEKMVSLVLILASVFLWFMGYNAVTTKLSDYAPNVLEMGFAFPMLIAQGAALISFVPIGILATKIGRKKTILIGVVMLTVCFGSVYFLTPNTSGIMYVLFAFTGIAWATINVNSYPMVVELSKGSNVGKYTGYYYTFSMGAQILTPILSGVLMDALGRKALFPYAAFFVALAFITMFFVKHGDSKVEKKGFIENFDVDMD